MTHRVADNSKFPHENVLSKALPTSVRQLFLKNILTNPTNDFIIS